MKMKTVQLAVAAVGAAALVLGGAVLADAHNAMGYYNIVVDIQEYEVTEYTDFDLVRMKVSIENLDVPMSNPLFQLGSDALWHPHVEYADVRGKGGDVSVNDCTSKGRFNTIDRGGTGTTNICFMIGKQMEPEALHISISMTGVQSAAHPTTSSSLCDTHDVSHGNHPCNDTVVQVIPFHAESVACFVNMADFCNQNNIQRIDGTPEPPPPSPEPEPMPEPEHTTLLHTMYNNHTGTLTLVFDQLVVAHNPGRIHFIHDINAFIEDGEAPDLGNAELHTVDNKRQSAILAFTLPDLLRLQVIESLSSHGDLALMIDTRAVYAAEGFVDITDGSQVLVPNILVVQ